MNALTNGVLVGPEELGKALVNDCRSWSRIRIPVIEEPAANEGNAHCLEVSGSYHTLIRLRIGILDRNRLRVDSERTGAALATKRNEGDGSRRTNAGQFLYAVQQLAVEADPETD